jgi:hypothetical protein
VKRFTNPLTTLGALALLFLPGCFGSCFGSRDPTPVVQEPEENVESEPPFVQDVSVPDWPPPSASTVITAHVTDDEGLSRIVFDFAEYNEIDVSGTSATADVTGAELGEGFGTLHVIAYDTDGGWTHQTVTNFLVDLSPPKGALVTGLVRRAEGVDLQAWVGDAWVLGGAELTFGGVTRGVAFEEGYPPTIGVEWDTSLVTLPTIDFPEGSGLAELRVWDAAGHESVTEVQLTLDGTAPLVAITSPAPQSTVSGLVTIEVSGSDEGMDPVQIDVYVAGTPIATLPGPAGKVTVDVSELAKGAATIEAIARDLAGNSSEAASIDVVIE